jgi:hypothetical protein
VSGVLEPPLTLQPAASTAMPTTTHANCFTPVTVDRS